MVDKFENAFYLVLYSLAGSIYSSLFYQDSFFLTVNGNGGFVGSFLTEGYLKKILMSKEEISFFFLIFVIFLLFLLSINFKFNYLIVIKDYIFKFNIKKKSELNLKESIDINTKNTEQDVQENFTFDNLSRSKDFKKKNLKLPPINFLETISKGNAKKK